MLVEEQEKICNEKFKTIFNTLEKLEKNIENIHELSVSVAEIALSVNNICETIKKQNVRLDNLESQKSKMLDEITKIILSSVIGAVVGFIVAQIK